MENKDLYEILGVSKGANEKGISKENGILSSR